MDLYHSWIYVHILNAEWFVWSVVLFTFAANILSHPEKTSLTLLDDCTKVKPVALFKANPSFCEASKKCES